jgi:hypothetical protein
LLWIYAEVFPHVSGRLKVLLELEDLTIVGNGAVLVADVETRIAAIVECGCPV